MKRLKIGKTVIRKSLLESLIDPKTQPEWMIITDNVGNGFLAGLAMESIIKAMKCNDSELIGKSEVYCDNLTKAITLLVLLKEIARETTRASARQARGQNSTSSKSISKSEGVVG